MNVKRGQVLDLDRGVRGVVGLFGNLGKISACGKWLQVGGMEWNRRLVTI